jgi:hypothetical protein
MTERQYFLLSVWFSSILAGCCIGIASRQSWYGIATFVILWTLSRVIVRGRKT